MSASLLTEVLAYCKRTDTSHGVFGHAAASSGDFIARMQAGRAVGPRRAEQVRAFMRDNPHGIARRRAEAREASGLGHADPHLALPTPIGPAPFPPIARVAEDHPSLAVEISAEAARQGRGIADLLSELVARGWAATQRSKAHG